MIWNVIGSFEQAVMTSRLNSPTPTIATLRAIARCAPQWRTVGHKSRRVEDEKEQAHEYPGYWPCARRQVATGQHKQADNGTEAADDERELRTA